jgi:hypothetical protein
MKIKEDSTVSRPPPTAPNEELIVVAVPIVGGREHQEESLPEAALATVITVENDNHHLNLGNDDGDDATHAAEAAAARARGTDLIRDHLDHHLDQNPHSSYVTWIATLHPENAVVAIDPRFHVPGNPWLTVYEDAVHRRKSETPPTTSTVVVIDNPQDDGRHEDKCNHVCGHQGFLDLIVGWSLTLAAVLTTISLELIAMYFLFSIWLCFKITSPDRGCFGPPLNILTMIPFCVCHLLLGIFILMNDVVFFLSILLVEIIAGINFLLCTLFSLSYKVGLDHHQRSRRSAHLIRWAFRSLFEDLDPSVRGSSALACCAEGEAAALRDHQEPGNAA